MRSADTIAPKMPWKIPVAFASPCKNCTEREMGCHSKCEKYKGYSIALSEKRKADHAERIISDYVISEKIKNMRSRERSRMFFVRRESR